MQYLLMVSFMVNLMVGGAGYWYYNSSQATIAELNQQLAAQAIRDQEQKRTIETLQDTLEKTTLELKNQSDQNALIEARMNRYLAIFRNHDLTKLAAAKPRLIEQRVNEGTRNVFNEIENISSAISALDD